MLTAYPVHGKAVELDHEFLKNAEKTKYIEGFVFLDTIALL